MAASKNAAAEQIIVAVCRRLIAVEADLNRLDAKAGDGDTGTTVAIGARSVQDRLGDLPLADTSATLAAIGSILSSSMGGSSGVLLSIFFTAASKALQGGARLPDALLAGLDRMTFYGGAQPGDRTMIDALHPALNALANGGIARRRRGSAAWRASYSRNAQGQGRAIRLSR